MIFGVGSTPPPAAKVYHQPLQIITDRYRNLLPRAQRGTSGVRLGGTEVREGSEAPVCERLPWRRGSDRPRASGNR